MPFQKGKISNPNGRPKGSVNKNKALVTAFVDITITNHFEKFTEELNKLKGKEFINVFLRLSKIMTHENTGLMANKKLIELFNEKIKQNGTNK